MMSGSIYAYFCRAVEIYSAFWHQTLHTALRLTAQNNGLRPSLSPVISILNNGSEFVHGACIQEHSFQITRRRRVQSGVDFGPCNDRTKTQIKFKESLEQIIAQHTI